MAKKLPEAVKQARKIVREAEGLLEQVGKGRKPEDVERREKLKSIVAEAKSVEAQVQSN